MGSISKAIKRVIPKEIQPILPIAASMFGGPLVGSLLPSFGTGIGALALRQGLASGLTSAGVDLLTKGKVDPRTAGIAALMGGGGQYFKGAGETGKFFGKELGEKAKTAFTDAGTLLAPTEISEGGKFQLASGIPEDEVLGSLAKSAGTAATAGGTISAYDAAEEAKRKYEEEIAGKEADAAADRQERIDYIRQYMGMAGFSDAEIDEALKEEGYQKGGRVGYRIGGGPVKSFIAKLLGAEPSEEVLNKMFEERKKEIFNNMFDSEAGTGVYSMKQMQEADEMATKQAMQELEEFKERIGMEMENPPEGSVSDKMINQIMEPRKEGRVKEANGGRIGFKDGSNPLMEFLNNLSEKERKKALDKILDSVNISYKNPYKIFSKPKEDGENQTPGQEILKQLKDFDVLPPMDDMGYMDETMQRLLKTRRTPSGVRVDEARAEGGRIGYAEGGGSSSTEQQKRENYFDLKRDELMSLSEYLLSPMSNADLRSGKYAEGGIMNLKMGGTPTEMDLRGGGFVPIGAKEKADDVPARLSKNEFVMTADAVRAAGGGSVNKGAKRMYDLMNNLEARV
jgi:hypothetical protein